MYFVYDYLMFSSTPYHLRENGKACIIGDLVSGHNINFRGKNIS